MARAGLGPDHLDMTNLTVDPAQLNRARRPTSRSTWAIWALAALLSIGLALFSYRYMSRIGPGAPRILGNALAKPWLYVHIFGAATALLIGPLQLLPVLRSKGRPWHRWLGRAYVLSCLVGGVGGLVSAFGSTAGPIAVSGFATLAVLWIVINGMGWLRATQRRFAEHRRWMIYSFTLTFAAVTLRIYIGIFPLLPHVTFLAGYRASAWVSWMGNLLVAELYLRGVFRKRDPVAAG
jgi:uncharacterized membrane protein